MATRSEIINMVLAKLDEFETHTGASQNPSDVLVDSIMDESALNMLRNAPKAMLIPIKVNTSAAGFIHAKDLTNGTGNIALPADFIRLYSFKMKAWKQPITDYISIVNPKYKHQQTSAIRGGVSKPVVVINFFETTSGLSINDFDLNDPAPGV
jgi:hypothetical protein